MKWVSINHYYPVLEVDKDEIFATSREVIVQLVTDVTCTARWGGKIHGWIGLLPGYRDCDVIAWTECNKETKLQLFKEWHEQRQKQKELDQGIYDTSIFDDLSTFHKMTKEELAIMAGSFFYFVIRKLNHKRLIYFEIIDLIVKLYSQSHNALRFCEI